MKIVKLYLNSKALLTCSDYSNSISYTVIQLTVFNLKSGIVI